MTHSKPALHWTPVTPPKNYPITSMGLDHNRWSPGAKQCYELNKNCALCDNHKVTGMYYEPVTERPRFMPMDSLRHCWMPVAVQLLLDMGKEPPIEDKRISLMRTFNPTAASEIALNAELGKSEAISDDQEDP